MSGWVLLTGRQDMCGLLQMEQYLLDGVCMCDIAPP